MGRSSTRPARRRRVDDQLDQLSFRRLRVLGTTFSVRTREEQAEVCEAVAADRVRANVAAVKVVLELLA